MQDVSLSFLAPLHPVWKMRGLRDKLIQSLPAGPLAAAFSRLATQGDVPGAT
jgi:hypothetical protein